MKQLCALCNSVPYPHCLHMKVQMAYMCVRETVVGFGIGSCGNTKEFGLDLV